MAQFANMFEVDLNNRSYPVSLVQTVSEGNVNSNRIGAYVYKDGQPYNLGGACTGLVMRADGMTVPMTGVIDGNAAYVVLNQESCAIPGPIQVAVSWVSGSNTTTLLVAYGTVITTDTRSYVQSGPIADVNTLLGYIGEVEQAAADAAESAASAAESAETAQNKCVRFDTAQSLTTTQKTTARGNIDAAGLAQVVRYDADQSLTTTQKSTARGNIDAAGLAQVVRYDSAQTLTDTQKTTARGNIDVPSSADLSAVDDKLGRLSILGNAVAPIRGTISYDSTQHVITLSNVLLYPKSDLGWTTAINATIDFSESAYPENLKALLVNVDTQQAIVYSVEDDTPLDDVTKWHPVCVVIGARYYWTASVIPSVYYLNGVDIYEKIKGFPMTFVGINAGADMSYLFSLAVTISSNTVRIDKTKEFVIYGVYGDNNSDMSIGTQSLNPDVVFPDEGVSIPVSYDVAYLVADTSSHTVKLVNRSALNSNPVTYVLIAYIYRDTHAVSFGETRVLFESIPRNNLTVSGYEANVVMRLISMLGNAVIPTRGTINFDAISHTITLTNVIVYPKNDLGWTTAINATVDFSSSTYPNHLKVLLINTDNNQIKVYSAEDNDGETLHCKANWHPICVVYAGKYLWTPSVVNGTYYVNGNDIYGGNDSSFRHDLYKEFQRVGVAGDSLSVGYSYNPVTGETLRRNLKYSWPKYVMRDAGVPWLNLGQSGMTVLTWCSDATYGKVQAEESGNKCQAYIIGLGENDQYNNAVPLGSASDISDNPDTVATTYYGGYARIINILKRVNPDCLIFCLTNPNPNGNRAEYNTAVRYIAGTHFGSDNNVFLVEMAAYTPEFRDANSLIYQDGVNITSHYSPVGYRLIASIMEEAISHRMMADINAFKLVAFIPYDTGDPTPNTMTE